MQRESTPEGRGEGARIRHAREVLGWNQARLAEEMGMSQEGVSAYEGGRAIVPPGKRVRLLASALRMDDVQVHALLGRITGEVADAAMDRWYASIGQIKAADAESSVTRAREQWESFRRSLFSETSCLATA